jgi:tyrosine-protein phosphatase SIW14
MRFIRIFAAICALGDGLAFAQVTAGVPNFHKVNDHVYRGAQPADDGFKDLARIGIKTIVDLRDEPDLIRAEKRTVEAAGMHFVSIPMHGLSAPGEQQIAMALGILNDQAAGPVFVHCRRGADRTGTVIACYRISADHWQNDKALAEARSLGMSWVERAMQHYVMSYHAAPAGPVVVATQQ